MISYEQAWAVGRTYPAAAARMRCAVFSWANRSCRPSTPRSLQPTGNAHLFAHFPQEAFRPRMPPERTRMQKKRPGVGKAAVLAGIRAVGGIRMRAYLSSLTTAQ